MSKVHRHWLALLDTVRYSMNNIGDDMYKVTIKRPEYLSEEVFISPDSAVVCDFVGDKLCDLRNSGDKKTWAIVISETDIRYLGEYLE